MRRFSVRVNRRSMWAALALCALAPLAVMSPVSAQEPESVTIQLEVLNESGIEGTATLQANDGTTMVTVELTGTDDEHPMHIHANSCDKAEAAPTYPLTNAVGDEPTTTLVNASLSDLLANPYSIIVHQPTAELADLLDPSQYVACGDITAAGGPEAETNGEEAAPVTGIGTAAGGTGSDRALLIGLVAVAGLLGIGGLVLRRQRAER